MRAPKCTVADIIAMLVQHDPQKTAAVLQKVPCADELPGMPYRIAELIERDGIVLITTVGYETGTNP